MHPPKPSLLGTVSSFPTSVSVSFISMSVSLFCFANKFLGAVCLDFTSEHTAPYSSPSDVFRSAHAAAQAVAHSFQRLGCVIVHHAAGRHPFTGSSVRGRPAGLRVLGPANGAAVNTGCTCPFGPRFSPFTRRKENIR